jgi:hypothetical protein
MSCAGDPGWLTRKSLRAFFHFPFVQLKCRRVTGIVHRKNKRARDVNERMGFRLEGVCKHGFETGDAIIYGMTRAECRWIEQANGQKSCKNADTYRARPHEDSGRAVQV